MLDENWSLLKTAKPKTDLQPVPGVGRAFCIPLAIFQAEIPLFKYLPKETLLHFARPILFGLNPLNSSRVRIQNITNPILDTKHRNVLFRTLSTKATYVFVAQYLLN